MKPPPRLPIIRKTIKWGGAAVTVLLVVAWIGSGWSGVRADISQYVSLRIDFGCFIWIVEKQQSFEPGVTFGRPMHAPSLEFVWWSPNPRLNPVFHYVPLWPLVLVGIGATAATWRLDTLARRRAKLNLCRKCSYDRTGLAAGAVCPECGAGAG